MNQILFSDDMIVYVESPKESTKEPVVLPNLINEFSKGTGH